MGGDCGLTTKEARMAGFRPSDGMVLDALLFATEQHDGQVHRSVRQCGSWWT